MAWRYRVVEILDPALPGGGTRYNVAVFDPKAKVPDYPREFDPATGKFGAHLTYLGPHGEVVPEKDPTCEPSPFGLPEGTQFVQVDVPEGADAKEVIATEVKVKFASEPTAKQKKLIGHEGSA